MNQTLARSINTSLVAIVPVLSVLVVGSFILGATSLQDFGLALVIGLTSGAYSSIFIASPLLAMMKEREPRYIDHPPATRSPGGAGRGADPGQRRGHGRGRRGESGGPRAGPPTRPRGSSVPGRPVVPPGVGPPPRWPSVPPPVAPRAAHRLRPGDGRAASGSTRPGGTRPPPRPRKGKGKGGKGKRR